LVITAAAAACTSRCSGRFPIHREKDVELLTLQILRVQARAARHEHPAIGSEAACATGSAVVIILASPSAAVASATADPISSPPAKELDPIWR
jgi:hypothetical protein